MCCAIWYHLSNFTKIKTPPWVFFTFFKGDKWHQIAQRITSFQSLIFELPNAIILAILLTKHVSDLFLICMTITLNLNYFCSYSSQSAWDASERYQSDLHWERHFRDLLETSQKRCLFCDVFKTSQKHLKKMSFSRRLWDVSKTSLTSIFGFSKITHKNDFVWFP